MQKSGLDVSVVIINVNILKPRQKLHHLWVILNQFKEFHFVISWQQTMSLGKTDIRHEENNYCYCYL